MKTKSILITGASGLVGKYLLEKLVQEGHEIHVLVHHEAVSTSVFKVITGDILDVAILEEAIKEVEMVIHAAAIVTFSPKRFDKMYQINVEGTRNVANVCLKLQKPMFHISSVAALGRGTKTQIDEESTWSDSDVNSYYAKTKYLAELEVWRAIEEGLQASIACPSVVLGVHNPDRSSSKLFKYVLDGKKFYTAGLINYIDVRDLANVISRMVQNPIWGEKFILSAGAISYKDFFEMIARNLSLPAPNIKVTKFLAALAWRIEAIKALFTKKEPLVTKETAKLSQTNYVYKNNKIINAYNIEFKQLDNSVAWCCEILKEKEAK